MHAAVKPSAPLVGRAVRAKATRVRAIPETLYFPVFSDSRQKVPLAHQAVFPLAGCHMAALTGTGGRPRIIAFGSYEAAKAAIPLLREGHAVYEVGPSLRYTLDKPGEALDLAFVHVSSPLHVGTAIGSHMCDVCTMACNGQFVVLTSWNVDVQRDLDRFRISIPEQ